MSYSQHPTRVEVVVTFVTHMPDDPNRADHWADDVCDAVHAAISLPDYAEYIAPGSVSVEDFTDRGSE